MESQAVFRGFSELCEKNDTGNFPSEVGSINWGKARGEKFLVSEIEKKENASSECSSEKGSIWRISFIDRKVVHYMLISGMGKGYRLGNWSR